MYFVYLVECSDLTYYCGYTNNLNNRIYEHNEGKNGAKYTKNRRPVRLIYHETFQSKSEAMKREYEIKKLSKTDKIKLVASLL
jgi:putative endonuclease